MRKDLRYTDEDAALVASWRRGDISSFETLVVKYQKRMLNIAYRITGDYGDACDLVQDAFVAASRGIDSFRGAARFSTWLTAITVSLSSNRLRRVPPAPSSRERPERPAGDEPQKCITALAADLREAIVLRDIHGFSCEEICAILKIREGTVKSRLSVAREVVKDCLKGGVGKP